MPVSEQSLACMVPSDAPGLERTASRVMAAVQERTYPFRITAGDIVRTTERSCFLCGESIVGRSTDEHILADAFLKEFDLKREKLTFGAPKPIEYSRLKVPAHPACNSGVGSQFENYLLSLTRSMGSNLDTLAQLHLVSSSRLVFSVREAVGQWLTKLMLGFTSWEVGLKKHPNPLHQENLREQLKTPLVAYLQACFKHGHHFNCPSSTYYFALPEPEKAELRFDFSSRLEIPSVYIRFGRHLLVACPADGYLVTEWLNDGIYQELQRQITQEGHLSYLKAVGHVWAVRELLPVQPRLEFDPASGITDRSREGLTERPPIDADGVNARADEIYRELHRRYEKPIDQ